MHFVQNLLTFMTSNYNFEVTLIFFYKNILNITKEPFLSIKSQLFRKPASEI